MINKIYKICKIFGSLVGHAFYTSLIGSIITAGFFILVYIVIIALRHMSSS